MDVRVAGRISSVRGRVDYIDENGTLVKGMRPPSVMVTEDDDFGLIKPGTYPPGTIAFTAGREYAWQLAADGKWYDASGTAYTPSPPAPNYENKSGNPIHIADAENASLSACVLTEVPHGPTDATPDNIGTITGVTGDTLTISQTFGGDGVDYTLTIPEAAGDVYGCTFDPINGKMAVTYEAAVLTGEENISSSTAGGFPRFQITNAFPANSGYTGTGYCTHFIVNNKPLNANDADLTITNRQGYRHLYMRYDACETTDELKTYLAEQYANGTPVTYVVARHSGTTKPEYEIDTQDIKTFSGENWAKAQNASNIALTYQTEVEAQMLQAEIIGALDAEGRVDYVLGTSLYMGGHPVSIMVTAEADLSDIPAGAYPPGSRAFTAGRGSVWELDASGVWQTVSGGGTSDVVGIGQVDSMTLQS